MRPARLQLPSERQAPEIQLPVEAAAPVEFAELSRWMDHELAKLEFTWRKWSTPGYGYWRSSLTGEGNRGR
jgi:hypothetical protein